MARELGSSKRRRPEGPGLACMLLLVMPLGPGLSLLLVVVSHLWVLSMKMMIKRREKRTISWWVGELDH